MAKEADDAIAAGMQSQLTSRKCPCLARTWVMASRWQSTDAKSADEMELPPSFQKKDARSSRPVITALQTDMSAFTGQS